MSKIVENYKVEGSEWSNALDKAFNKINKKVKIDGFRQGKAPRNIYEKKYGKTDLYVEASDELVHQYYHKLIDEKNIIPVAEPQVNLVKLDDNGMEVNFTFFVKPEVTLGEYKGIKVEKSDVEVTDEEVNAEIDAAREQNARTLDVTDRAAEDKDIVTIDFEGFVDGEAFEGGKGTDYPLTLGSHSFIDNFEEQIVGKSIGDEFDVNVTFPEEYHVKELANKPAVFKVALKAIKAKELPELNDEFAQDVSEFDTVDEYKADVKATILKRKEEAAKNAKEDKVIETIIENATMEIPEPMITTQVKQMADDFARRIQAQGLSLEQYFQFTGMDANKFMETLKPQALKKINSRLVLEAVVNAENIEVSDDEVNGELEKLAEAYKMEIDKVKELMGNREMEAIKMDIAVQKAVDFVTDAAVEA